MKLFLMLTVVLSTACVQFKGNLNVDQHLMYKKNNSTQLLLAGDYKASAKMKEDKIVLKLDGTFEKHKMTLNFPKNSQLPTTNGDIDFSGQQINQPFAVKGHLATAITRTTEVTATERCSLNIATYDCMGSGYSYCHGRTVWGVRKVRYYETTTTHNLFLNLIQEETEKATLNATEIKKAKIYTYTGLCSRYL